MALIKCPECGKEISNQSKQCVHCGHPINGDTKKGTVGGAVMLLALSAASLLSLLCFPFTILDTYSEKELTFWQTVHYVGSTSGHTFASLLLMGVFIITVGGVLKDLGLLSVALSKSEKEADQYFKRNCKLSVAIEDMVMSIGFLLLALISGFEDLFPAVGWFLYFFIAGSWTGIKLGFSIRMRWEEALPSTPKAVPLPNRKRICCSCGYCGTEQQCPRCGSNQWLGGEADDSEIPTKICDYCGEEFYYVTDVVVSIGETEQTKHLCTGCAQKYKAGAIRFARVPAPRE